MAPLAASGEGDARGARHGRRSRGEHGAREGDVHDRAMKAKTLVMIGMIVGSTIGGCVPSLWGAGAFSLASVVLGVVGGLAGIWAGFRLSRM